MTKNIKLALERGKFKGAIKLLEEEIRNRKKQEWLDKKKEEYSKIFPRFRDMTKEEKAEYDEKNFSEDNPKPEDFVYPQVEIQYITIDEDGNEVRTPENYLTFNEWLNEEEIAKEAVVDENGNILEPEEKRKVRECQEQKYEEIKDEINTYLEPYRFKRLQTIFSEKATGLKKLAIDKPWMTDKDAINDQFRVYEEMYKNAKMGAYDEDTNNAIITANEQTKLLTAPVTLLLNTIRSILEVKIKEQVDNIDYLLNQANAISLTKEDLTDEKITEIKKDFGLA